MYAADFVEELTRPLTAEEAADGTYAPPDPPRIAMTGTYEEIYDYFDGDDIPHMSGGPWSWMTIGLPIVPPTEERVAQMLTGTSHAPDEVIGFGRNRDTGLPKYEATIEKIAVNAVMAGCKPEYMPVVLAIAESGACVGYGGDSSMGHLYFVSGPYGKEIGMNDGFAFLVPGNRANESIQHACGLMGVNLGYTDFGINMLERSGGAWGQIFAEHADTPWDTLGEHYGYKSDESVLVVLGRKVHINPFQNIEVQNATDLEECQAGTPDHIVSALKTCTNTYGCIVNFGPDTAGLYKKKYGWNTISDIQNYLWEKVTWPAGEWYKNYWFVTHHHAQSITEPKPGEKRISTAHLDLPADAQVPKFWDPESITIIVAGGTGDSWTWGPHGAVAGSYKPRTISIDKWR
jgi:hypothetical protein